VATREHVRIIVGTAPGPRSGRWQIDTSDDDIYVSHEGLRDSVKTSLHRSGQNHHRVSESAADRWMHDGDRYIMKWGAPKEFGPARRKSPLLEIVIPTDNLTIPVVEPSLPKRERTALLDPASPGDATVISLVLIRPGTTLRPPRGVPSVRVASVSLPTRGQLVIVGTHQPYADFGRAVDAAMPGMSDQFIEQFGGTRRALSAHTDPMRAVLWMAPDDAGVPRMVEVGVGIRSGRSPYRRRRAPLAWLRRRLALT